MTEATSGTRHITIEEVQEIPAVEKWDKRPNPVVSQVQKAIERHVHKPQRVLNLDTPSTHDGIHLLPAWAGFEVLRIGQRRGAKDLLPRGGSAHQVVFCIASVRAPDGLTTNCKVAIKPFAAVGGVFEEAVANAHVLERGFSTTNPICIATDHSLGNFLITPAKEGVQPLDTEPWHQFQTRSSQVQEHFIARLRGLATTLASYNARGIRHGDPQLKNFWATIGGDIEGFDWESARIYPSKPSAQELHQAATSDLGIVFKSLSGEFRESQIHALNGHYSARLEQFKSYVLNPYAERVIKSLDESGNLTEEHFDIVYALTNNTGA